MPDWVPILKRVKLKALRAVSVILPESSRRHLGLATPQVFTRGVLGHIAPFA